MCCVICELAFVVCYWMNGLDSLAGVCMCMCMQGEAFFLVRTYAQLSTLILRGDNKRVTRDGLLSRKFFLKEVSFVQGYKGDFVVI